MADSIEYTLLAALRPADTDEHEMYVVPADTEINAPLRVCNQSDTEQTYGVAHTAVSGVAQGSEWIVFNGKLPAGKSDEISIHAKAGQTVRVRSGAADLVNFHLSGQKITKGAS